MKHIGLVAWKVGSNSFGATIPYLDYLQQFGIVSLITPQSPINPNLDLLVLPGGPDVNPARYGAIPDFYTTAPCVFKEYFDVHHLPRYIQANVPIFGICRGHQTLAIHFGGVLHQNMCHEISPADERYKLVHKIEIEENYRRFYEINPVVQKEGIKVNSLHHQIVMNDEYFPAELVEIATHPTGTNEALCHRTLPIASVQYHPEELYVDRLANTMIETLLEFGESPWAYGQRITAERLAAREEQRNEITQNNKY